MFLQKEIWFRNGDKKIYSLSYIPEGEGPRPVILICHGFGGSHRDNLNCAERYAAAGYAVCSFDFCGGSPTVRSDGATTEMSPMTELADLMALFPQLLAQDFVDPAAVYLWGESLGGFVAAMGAARLKGQVKGLILLYPALRYQALCRSLFPSKEAVTATVKWDVPLGPCYYRDVWDVDPFAEIGAYKGPVLLFHGTQDDVVPISVSERARTCYEDVTYRTVEGAGHGFFGEVGEEVDRQIVAWLKARTGGEAEGTAGPVSGTRTGTGGADAAAAG